MPEMSCPSPVTFARCVGFEQVRASRAASEWSTSLEAQREKWPCSRCTQRLRPTTSLAPGRRRSVVPSQSQPLTKTGLAAYDVRRKLAEALLQSVREMQAGQVQAARRALLAIASTNPKAVLAVAGR
jgi:hypothetical protein